MYVRVFKADVIKLWKVDDIDKIPIEGLNLWNPGDDNDYSIFKFENEKNSSWALLRAIVSNKAKWGYGVDLLILPDEFLENYEIEDSEESLIKCSHSNIKNLTFKNYKEIINYTYKHQDKIITFKFENIKKIFIDMSESDSNDYSNFCNSLNKKKEIVKFLKTTYFPEFKDSPESLPIFLKDAC